MTDYFILQVDVAEGGKRSYNFVYGPYKSLDGVFEICPIIFTSNYPGNRENYYMIVRTL